MNIKFLLVISLLLFSFAVNAEDKSLDVRKKEHQHYWVSIEKRMPKVTIKHQNKENTIIKKLPEILSGSKTHFPDLKVHNGIRQ